MAKSQIALISTGGTIEKTYDDGTKQRHTVDVKHWLSGKKTKTLQFKKGVAKVVIDPDRITLDTSRRNNTWRK